MGLETTITLHVQNSLLAAYVENCDAQEIGRTTVLVETDGTVKMACMPAVLF